jgi:transcriptional regulator with XRE-family HTH domain
MAIGERIKRIRNFRNLTQKDLGVAIGFAERTADVRIAQYETGTRSPKEKYIETIASALDVTPFALNVPDIENYYGVLQTLFTLEDLYALKINDIDGELCITLNRESPSYHTMFDMVNAWNNEAKKYRSGEITKEDYDNWRYRYPASEAERTKASLDALRKKKKSAAENE